MAGVTAAQAADFRATGVVYPLPALTPVQIDAALAALARIEALPEPARKSALTTKSHLLSRTLWDIVHLPAIVEPVSALIGPDLLVWGAGFFKKAAGAPDYVSWHQDATYWGLEPPDIVTAWLALSPSTLESGCLRVVPGSHRWPIMPHRETYAENNLLSRGQEIAVDVAGQPIDRGGPRARADVAAPRAAGPQFRAEPRRLTIGSASRCATSAAMSVRPRPAAIPRPWSAAATPPAASTSSTRPRAS